MISLMMLSVAQIILLRMVEWFMNCRCAEGVDFRLVWGTIPTFSSRDTEKERNLSTRRTGFSKEILTWIFGKRRKRAPHSPKKFYQGYKNMIFSCELYEIYGRLILALLSSLLACLIKICEIYVIREVFGMFTSRRTADMRLNRAWFKPRLFSPGFYCFASVCTEEYWPNTVKYAKHAATFSLHLSYLQTSYRHFEISSEF